MINFPPEVLALYDAGTIVTRGLIRFEFGTGTYGFIKSMAPFEYNGLTYKPGGLINVSDLQSAMGLVAQQFTITLASSMNDDLTPEVLQTIEQEDYRDRPVYIYDADFHPDTGALLYVQLMKRGYVDVIRHKDSQDTGYMITMDCESRAIDYTRTNGRKRTDTDQRTRRNVNDGFYSHASMRGREEILWGQSGQAPQAPSSSGSYLVDAIKKVLPIK